MTLGEHFKKLSAKLARIDAKRRAEALAEWNAAKPLPYKQWLKEKAELELYTYTPRKK